MAAVPKEVMRTARDHVRKWGAFDTYAEMVAAAILAERKRCAEAVHRAAKDFYGNPDQMYAAARIAKAIEATQ